MGGLLIPISWAAAILFNLPRFFEFKTTPTILVEVNRNGSILQFNNITNISDETLIDGNSFHLTYDRELRKHPAYVLLYLFWGRIILIELIPYITTITVNVLVRRKLRALSSISGRDNEEGTYH